jgi:hypothetical protein
MLRQVPVKASPWTISQIEPSSQLIERERVAVAALLDSEVEALESVVP